MTNFYDEVILTDKRLNTIIRIDDPSLLEPTFRSKVFKIIAEAKAEGCELLIFETFRSKDRQRRLFSKGNTKLSEIGVHHFGLACDLVRSVNGKPHWDGDLTVLGKLAKKEGLIWGGDWGKPNEKNDFVDQFHIQRCSISKQPSLFLLEWYPSNEYDAYLDV